MADPIPIRPDRPAMHVELQPGGELVLRGSLYSSHDGARIDATTTTWPASAPGGASVDPGGLFALESGGFHVVSRDPITHEVHAVATGDDAPLCAVHNVAPPCLPLRLTAQARSRLLETRDWHESLSGTISIEVLQAPAYAPVADWATQAAPFIKTAGIGLAVVVAAACCVAFYRHRAASPVARLAALVKRVRAKAQRAAPLVAAPLRPALDSMLQALHSKRVEPRSPQGIRIADVLLELERTLDQTEQSERRAQEQSVADALSRDVEIALEAAAEAAQLR